MPTVLRVGPHRFFFYANERGEPPHIHVTTAERSAKFWLDPVALARSAGYDGPELRAVRALVETHRDTFARAWFAFHDRTD